MQSFDKAVTHFVELCMTFPIVCGSRAAVL